MKRITKKVDDNFDFDHEQKVMGMFTDNAKAYIQLAGAGLAGTVTFMDKFLHTEPGHKVAPGGWLATTWITLLVAIVAGAFYQYLAVKYLEQHLDGQSFQWWNWLAERCGIVYGIMLAAFYVAVV